MAKPLDIHFLTSQISQKSKLNGDTVGSPIMEDTPTLPCEYLKASIKSTDWTDKEMVVEWSLANSKMFFFFTD